MARNIELKAQVTSLDAIRARAEPLASPLREILQQADTFFAVPRGRLKVRERADGSGELISYERPDEAGPKRSTYFRSPCTDARALVETLARVLPIRGVVVKRREVLLVGRTRVHLDEVRNLGLFLELEVVLNDDEDAACGEREARALLAALQVPTSALIANAYIDLLEHRPHPA